MKPAPLPPLEALHLDDSWPSELVGRVVRIPPIDGFAHQPLPTHGRVLGTLSDDPRRRHLVVDRGLIEPYFARLRHPDASRRLPDDGRVLVIDTDQGLLLLHATEAMPVANVSSPRPANHSPAQHRSSHP